MIWLPIFVTVVGAFGLLQKKLLFQRTRIPETEFLTTSSLVLAVLVLIIGGSFGLLSTATIGTLAQPSVLLAIAAYVTVAAVGLWFFYQGFREESIVRYELSSFLEPIFIFFLAGLLFSAERDLRIYLAAAVALGAFAFAHLRGRHLRLQAGERLLVLAALMEAVQAIMERSLLETLTPFELYAVRVLSLAVVFAMVFGVHIHKHLFSHRMLGVMTVSAISFVYTIGELTSYQRYGVTLTNTVLLATPILLYTWAHLFYGEREPWKMTVAGVVTLGAVAYALSVIG